jgi:ribosomal protein S18 acetylase RimI-like enzyme
MGMSMPSAASVVNGTTAVLAAEPGHVDRVLGVLTLAFAADPPTRWLFPGSDEYLRHFPTFARALGGAALPRRTALATQDHAGVALWLAPDAAPDEGALARLIEEQVAPQRRANMAAVVEEMVRYHPQEPHWYLPMIGVEPARQGRGLGAALLRAALQRVDAEGLPAYLESTNPKNVPLYVRHGFEVIGEIKVGTCPPIVPMLRPPRRAWR